MKLYYDVAEAIQRYLVTRDTIHLHAAMGILAEEQRNPELQESILTLDNISIKAVEHTIATEGYLRISTGEITNSEGIPVLQDKYIRLVDKTAEYDTDTGMLTSTAIVLKVAIITDDFLLLVPYTPGSLAEGSIDVTNDQSASVG